MPTVRRTHTMRETGEALISLRTAVILTLSAPPSAGVGLVTAVVVDQQAGLAVALAAAMATGLTTMASAAIKLHQLVGN